MFHEQSRGDRHDHIRIINSAIKEGYESQFLVQNPIYKDNFSIPYDYGSIMHYGGRVRWRFILCIVIYVLISYKYTL